MKKMALGLMMVSMSMMLTACGNINTKKETENPTAIQILTGTTTEGPSTEKEVTVQKETKAETVAAETSASTQVTTQTDTAADAGDSFAAVGDADYPGPDVIEIVNLRGDVTTVYLLADGTYMDREERRFTYDGRDTWYDENGVEWNEKV